MVKFIKVTDLSNNVTHVSITHIVKIVELEEGGCRIVLSLPSHSGFNLSPTVTTKLSAAEIIELIK